MLVMMMIQKSSLNRLKIEYAVIDDLYFLVIEKKIVEKIRTGKLCS